MISEERMENKIRIPKEYLVTEKKKRIERLIMKDGYDGDVVVMVKYFD